MESIHQILKQKGDPYKRVTRLFGDEILNKEGLVDPQKLQEILSNSSDDRKAFAEIVKYPLLKIVLSQVSFYIFHKKSPIVFLESPFLLELPWLRFLCCPVIGLYLKSQKDWAKRLVKKYKCTEDEAKKKQNTQMSIMQMKGKVDIPIETSRKQEEINEELFERLVGYI